MMYVVIFLILLLCIYIYDICGGVVNKMATFYGIVFILILMSAISYRIGGDMEVYSYWWKFKCKPLSQIDLLEIFDDIKYERPGWIIITSFLKGIFNDLVILKIVHALWINLVVAYFIRTYTKYCFSVLLMYFVVGYFNYNFEILREGVAISFFLLAFPCYVERKWFRYFLFFLCAFMFHESALLMLLLPFMSILGKVNIFVMIGCLLGVYVLFMQIDLVGLLLQIVPSNFGFYSKFQGYMNSDLYGENVRINMYAFFFASFIVPGFFYMVLKKLDVNNRFAVYILISILFNLLNSKIGIFYRFNNYILLPLFIAYIDIISLISKKVSLGRFKNIFFIPAMLLYFLYKIPSVYFKEENIANGKFYNRYFPYCTIIDKNISEERAKFMDQIYRWQND